MLKNQSIISMRRKKKHIWKLDATLEKVKLKPIEVLYTHETLWALEWHWKAKIRQKEWLTTNKRDNTFLI